MSRWWRLIAVVLVVVLAGIGMVHVGSAAVRAYRVYRFAALMQQELTADEVAFLRSLRQAALKRQQQHQQQQQKAQEDAK